jgi:hypothetical protein
MKNTTILSYGGGKDSTLLIAIDQNREKAADLLNISLDRLNELFPKFDFAIFSDPGAEYDETYQTVKKAKDLLGDRLVIVNRDGENIEEWCMRLGIVPLMPGGSHICSKKFKGDVMAKYAKENVEGHITWQIGIEADEGRRVNRFGKPKGDGVTFTYPLIELDLNREAIDKILNELGWGDIHKSSCYFCPFLSIDELRDMYLNNPDKWELCMQLEERFKQASIEKHQAWLDAGKPLNKGGRAPRGMWRVNSYESGQRLFTRRINKKQLSVPEWAEYFKAERDA